MAKQPRPDGSTSVQPGDDIIPEFLRENSEADHVAADLYANPTLDGAEVSTADHIVEVRIEDFIAAGMLTPHLDWIKQTIWPAPKGYHVDVARLFGYATKVSRQETSYGESIKLEGMFESQSLITGEVMSAPVAYLPKKWARQVEAILISCGGDPSARVEMDLTIGAEATGGTGVPHRWTVVTHVQGNLNREMDRLRNRRRIAIGTRPAPQIEHEATHAPGHAD